MPSASGKTFVTTNPANNEPLAEVAEGGVEDVNRAVAAAKRAFEEGPWSRMTALDRQRFLFNIARLVRERLEELATLETNDCGKPIVESRADIAQGTRSSIGRLRDSRLVLSRGLNLMLNAAFRTWAEETKRQIGLIFAGLVLVTIAGDLIAMFAPAA